MMKKMSPPSSVQAPTSDGSLRSSTESVQALSREGRPLSVSQDTDRILKLRAKMERPKSKISPVVFAGIVAGMVVFGAGCVALAVFFLWLSSRLNFVLLDTIVTGEPSFKEPFKKHKEAGNSYFVWSLVFLGLSAFILLVTGLAGAGLLMVVKGNTGLSMMSGIFTGTLAIIILLAIIAIGTAMHDFVLPIMYHEKIPAMKAVNKLLKTGRACFLKIFQYLLVILGLWVLAMILQSIVGILVAIGGLIAGGMVAIPGIVLIKTFPLLKLPLIIFGSFVAMGLVLAVFLVISMVMLPVVIFFRVFALAYLTRLYPQCDLLGFSGKGS
jgi:hypothetical protein